MSVGPLGVLSDGFSSALAQPLKSSLPTQSFFAPGYTGSPRKFLNTLIYRSSELSSCSIQAKQDGSACAYMAFLLLMVMIGVVVPVVTTLYCCGFCIGRFGGERMQCCGAACKQPNCGGMRPSTEYGKKETRCCVCAVLFLFLIILTTALLGFLSTYQMSADVQSVIAAMESTLSLPNSLSREINSSVVNISLGLPSQVPLVNSKLDFSSSLVAPRDSVSSALKQLAKNFTSLQSDVEIQGQCQTLRFNGTSVTYDQTSRNFQSSSPALVVPLNDIMCCSQENQHGCLLLSHSGNCHFGNSTSMCPCCCTCLIQGLKIQAAISDLPTVASINALSSDNSISIAKLNSTLMNFTSLVQNAMVQYTQYFDLIDAALRPVKSSLGNQAGVIAGSVSIWALTAVAAGLAVFGFVMSRTSLWWTSYACGWVSNFLFFVLFGVSSLVVIPFGDICSGLPLTSQDPLPWLVTFTKDLNAQELNPILLRLNQDCLVRSNPTGQLWQVVGYSRQSMLEAFAPFNFTTRLSSSLRQLELGSSYTYWKQEVNASLTTARGLSEGYLSGMSGNTAYTSYESSISASWNRVSSSLDHFNSAQAAWETKVAEAKGQLQQASSQLGVLLGSVVDELTASGNCSIMNEAYMAVRSPMCLHLSKSLDSMWVLFFILALEWYPMFLVICRGVKHSQQRRGISKVDPSTQIIPTDIAEVKDEGSKEGEDGKESVQVVTEEAPRKKKKKKSKEDGDEAMARKRAAK
eukprot:753919-Hanusia_phi.AAC.1